MKHGTFYELAIGRIYDAMRFAWHALEYVVLFGAMLAMLFAISLLRKYV